MELELPTARVDLLPTVKPSGEITIDLSRDVVAMVILNPVKLTMKINYYTKDTFDQLIWPSSYQPLGKEAVGSK